MKAMLENPLNLEKIYDDLKGQYPDTYESWEALKDKFVSFGFDHLRANKLATRGLEYMHNYVPSLPEHLTYEWAEANNVVVTDDCSVSNTELLLIGLVKHSGVSLADAAKTLKDFEKNLSLNNENDALVNRLGREAIIISGGKIRRSEHPEIINAFWNCLVNFVETGEATYQYRDDAQINYNLVPSN